METGWPPFCQFVPEGLTVPYPVGAAEVVRVYCVIKDAVYVIFDEGAVIV
jgi:hypothetical protein